MQQLTDGNLTDDDKRQICTMINQKYLHFCAMTFRSTGKSRFVGIEERFMKTYE